MIDTLPTLYFYSDNIHVATNYSMSENYLLQKNFKTNFVLFIPNPIPELFKCLSIIKLRP